jgi:hypothetical protein
MARSGEMRCETADLLSRLAIPHVPGATKVRRSSRCFRGCLQQLSARRWTIAFAAVALPVLAEAQIATDIGRAPTLTIERYPERWSYLADPAQRMGRWTERFKYIPLSADGSTYLTTGVEVRSRYEGYANVNWGAAPDDGYVWHRFMPYVDFHADKLRLFAQPMPSGISGVRRAKRPVDTTGADMLQAFVEVEMEVANRTSLRISAGRKLISLGAGCFIDTRYGPNIPQAFDGFDMSLTGAAWQMTALYFRPVDDRFDDFDDRTSTQKALWGVYATQWLSQNRATGFDVFYLGLRDRNAVYDQGAGKELVHTFGTRIFGDTGTSYWNLEPSFSMEHSRATAEQPGGSVGRSAIAFRKPHCSPTSDSPQM